MSPTEYIYQGLYSLPAIVVFVETFLRTPVVEHMKKGKVLAGKAIGVIQSKELSDNQKEKVIPRYALQILSLSLVVFFNLALFLLVFLIVYFATGILFSQEVKESYNLILDIGTQIQIFIIGVGYAVVRKYLINSYRRSTKKNSFDYTFFSKLVHYFALKSNVVKETAFDIDSLAVSKLVGLSHSPVNFRLRRKLNGVSAKVLLSQKSLPTGPNVYIAGLARAGTTVLLEALFSTNDFSTLTYRNMPFVTAPYTWSKVARKNRIKGQLKDRAHGDRLLVNFDSPEAFEEVFWKTFLQDKYIKKDRLLLHSADTEIRQKYKQYVHNIINVSSDSTGPLRYLAKNNNNLLRLKTIKETFPEAIIVVPFRNPYDHAGSLLKQHNKFCQIHARDKFSLRYMNWLGHHEFGLNMKPFFTGRECLPNDENETRQLDYWLRYWHSIYSYLIKKHAQDIIFFDYDQLCHRPKESLNKIKDKLLLPDLNTGELSRSILPANKYEVSTEDRNLQQKLEKLHHRLRSLAL